MNERMKTYYIPWYARRKALTNLFLNFCVPAKDSKIIETSLNESMS